jgi:cytochrome bd ubiquinol oxidase subunit I
VPYLLSLIATMNPHGTVQGINNVERAYDKKYGPGSYKPVIPVTYWSFRLMVGFGSLAALLAALGLWLTRRRRIPRSRWFYRVALWALPLPYLATTMGWIFTEMGRQPWTVFGLLTTAQSVSAGVTVSSVIISLTVFTLLYAGLAAIAGWLTIRHVQAGAPEEIDGTGPGSSAEQPLPVFSY